jgi:hypothetical protein
LIITRKTLSFTLLHQSANSGHTFVVLLSFLKLIVEVGFDYEGTKITLRRRISPAGWRSAPA